MVTKSKSLSKETRFTINKTDLCYRLRTHGEGLMAKVVDRIIQFHRHRVSPILISGESGSGKEVVARVLQSDGKKLDPDKFYAVNCAVSDRNMIQSQLFGHEMGAYTDAKKSRKGVFRESEKQGVFLDEIDKALPEVGSSLLRYLRTGEIETLGADTFEEHKTQISFGTSERSDALLDEWKLKLTEVQVANLNKRELSTDEQKRLNDHLVEYSKRDKRVSNLTPDFLNRVIPFMIVMPPLRDRKRDLSCFVPYFIEKACDEFEIRYPLKVEPELLHFLIMYEWPGNIAELENFIRAGVVFSNKRVLSLEACLEIYAGKQDVKQLLFLKGMGDESIKPDFPRLTLPYLRIRDESTYSTLFLENATSDLGNSSSARTLKKDIPKIPYSSKAISKIIDNLYHLRMIEQFDDLYLLIRHRISIPDRDRIKEYVTLRLELKLLKDIQARMGFDNRVTFNNWRKKNHVDGS